MDRAHTAFFFLLNAGLWEEGTMADTPPPFPLAEKEWAEVYLLAREQTVTGIIFDGMVLLPPQCLPPRPLLMKWTAEVDRIERMNRRMNKVLAELAQLFAAQNIKAVLLKGQGVGACYHAPLHRLCGDVDWCFPVKGDWKRAKDLIAANGIETRAQAGFSLEYRWKDCLIEHHKRVLDVHNPFLASYVKRLISDEMPYGGERAIGETRVNVPSPLLTHLSVNIHILKHMLAFGVGLRQLCDVACVYRHYYKEIDGRELERIYRRVGILRWVQVLNALLVKYLGVPACCLPFPLAGNEQPDWMMENVMQAGNFGFYDKLFDKEMSPVGQRKNKMAHLLRRFKMNVCYAPAEACWFPLVQMYSRVKKW